MANEDQLRSEQEANEFLRQLWQERAQDAERAATRIARSNLEAVSRGNDPVLNRVRTKYDPKGDKPLRDTAKEAAAEQARLAALYQSTAEAGIAAIRAQETEVERLTRDG